MRLDFNVLWVDDQPNRINAQIESIRLKMEDNGFEFNAQKCETFAEVTGFIATDIFMDEIDLILVDWDLGNDAKGQDVIAAIRENIRYKDVVFYSALENPDRLRALAFDAKLEGVYCASRENLVDEVMGVFDSLVKKVLDLDHTRGIVMGATCDIDYMVMECLVGLHKGHDDAGKSAMVADALKMMSESLKSSTKKVEKLKDGATFDDILRDHGLFNASHRLRALTHQLTDEEHGKFKAVVLQYIAEVVPSRNDLGHQVLTPENKKRAIIGYDGKEVSIDQMRALRRLLLGMRKDFRSFSEPFRAGV